MIPRLKYSEKYQNDLKRFKHGVEKITNPQSKQKGISLINELERKVSLIDEIHSDSGFTNIKTNKEQIAYIVKLRTQLEHLIK